MKNTLLAITVGMLHFFNLSAEFGDKLYKGEPDSPHFIIRWAFQDYCDHVYDMRTDKWVWPTSKKGVSFDPQNVKPADIIFVREVDNFFATLHKQIQHPYIMVTHGEHLEMMTKDYMKYLDDEKLIMWFGIHPCQEAMDHHKFQPLPLGVQQQPDRYTKRQKLDSTFKTLRSVEKKHLLYMNFADFQKPERKHVRSLFIKAPFCKHGERQSFSSYLNEMAQVKFCLSPQGLGPDCYRTWEALLVGSIPVMRKCALDPMYEGLPVLLVDTWEEVTEDFLNKKYTEITSKKYDISKLYMNYWLEKIESVRKKYLAKN